MSTGLAGDERLVVWMPRWLGDFQMAEPLVAALAQRWAAHPERLVLLAPRAYQHLVREAGLVLSLVDAEDEAAVDSALHACEVALLLRGSFRSAWRAWRAGVPRRIGWARDGRRWLLTDCMAPAREAFARPFRRSRILARPFATAVQELAALVGIPMARTEPRLVVTDHAQIAAAKRLAEGGINPARPFVLINVGGRPGSAKAYTDWQFIAAHLLADGVPVVAVCGPGEERRMDAVDAMLGPSLLLRDPVPELVELAALGSLAAVCLTADGGPRHIFAAVGTPVIALFGPTDPRHTASHLGRTTAFVGRVDCAPCHTERCPFEGPAERACFRAIDPNRILQAALSYVRTPPSSPKAL